MEELKRKETQAVIQKKVERKVDEGRERDMKERKK